MKISKYKEFNENKSVSLDELKVLLKEKFPNIWLRDGKDFGEDYIDSLWTTSSSYIDDKREIPMFDYDSEFTSLYDMGVHVDLVEFLDKYGYYVESYDPETFLIVKG